MKASIITIGDEILIGQIVDTNSAWMAQRLNLQGFKIENIYSISDRLDAILQTLSLASKESDLILITGGLGPTKDDITKKALADYFGVGMVFHDETFQRIQRLFERWGRTMTPAHRDQCYMPENAVLLRNKMGTAPGMWFEREGKVFVSMPGVPYEMQYLMKEEILPKLKSIFPGRPIAHRTILTVGEGESRIARRIEQFEDALPQHIKLAYLPGLGSVRLRLSGSADDALQLNDELDGLRNQLVRLIPELVFGYENERLAEVVGRLLTDQHKTLATAESCTGGHIAHQITSVPGSSTYFTGSIVAYSNQVKEEILGVRRATLEKQGAVSEATVIEMVDGALKLFRTDVAVAVSGIAGPGGGTPEKPVGTVWLAIGDGQQKITQKLQLGKDRMRNIEYSSVQALNMIRKFLISPKLN